MFKPGRSQGSSQGIRHRNLGGELRWWKGLRVGGVLKYLKLIRKRVVQGKHDCNQYEMMLRKMRKRPSPRMPEHHMADFFSRQEANA